MALIICPECECSVSDTAENCPKCGYSIKDYIEKQKQLELLAEQKTSLQKELEQKLKEVDKLPKPEKPSLIGMFSKKNRWLIYITIPVTLVFFIGFIVMSVLSKSFEIFSFIGTIFWAWFSFATFSDAKKEYETALDTYEDWEGYKAREKERIKKDYAYKQKSLEEHGIDTAHSQMSASQASNVPKCPVCGSTRIKKISTISRAISVEMVGVASSKIGKQMECEQCGYKF